MPHSLKRGGKREVALMELKRNTNITVRWCDYWQLGVTGLHGHHPLEGSMGAGDVAKWTMYLNSTLEALSSIPSTI